MVMLLSSNLWYPIVEQVAPKLASAGKIAGAVIILTSAINVNVNLLNAASYQGFSIEELIGLVLGVSCLIVAFFASRERKIVPLNNNISLEEQLEQLESLPTSSSTERTNEQSQSSHTKAIVESIIGSNQGMSQSLVNDAIDKLTDGDFGLAAQGLADELPAPHMHARDVQITPKKSDEVNSGKYRASVPLPSNNSNQNRADSEKPKLENDDITRNPKSPKKPQTVSPLPDLSDLFEEHKNSSAATSVNSEKSAMSDTPELPNLDDLF